MNILIRRKVNAAVPVIAYQAIRETPPATLSALA